MALYRKKPVVIDAWQIGSDDPIPKWLEEAVNAGIAQPYCGGNWWVIKTLEGDHRGYQRDYIIRGVEGELYPCKPGIFEQTYERVEGGE